VLKFGNAACHANNIWQQCLAPFLAPRLLCCYSGSRGTATISFGWFPP